MTQHPDATIVAGATDIGVRINKSLTIPRDDPRSEPRRRVGRASASRTASWCSARGPVGRRSKQVCEDAVPEFHKIVAVFGAPQIRHVGTIGGNIANASPIADSLPFLFVMEAMLELAQCRRHARGEHQRLLQGYKKFDLRPGELITAVRIPLPADDELLRLYKVSRRRDLDIATFTAAIRMRLDGDTIADAAIAFGAVGPTVIRARKTEAFLRGRPFDEETMRARRRRRGRRNHADQRRPRRRRLPLPTDAKRAAEVLSRNAAS